MVNKRKWKKRLSIAIIVVVTFSLVSFAATKIIYDLTFSRYECGVTTYPAALQEMVKARTQVQYSSGEHILNGYLYSCNGDQKQNTLLVLVPGYHACSDSYLWQIHELNLRGWSVFAFDPTGCCSSQGDSAVGFPQEVLDVKATLEYLAKQNNFCYNNIALLGHSRGGYAACCSLAYSSQVAAVISVSGINSAMEGVVGSAAEYVGPLAYGNYGFLWLYQTMLFGSQTVNLRVDRILEQTNTPVLLIHGQEDTTVPLNKYSIVSHRENFKNTNTKIVIRSAPDNAGHTNLLFDGDGTANNEVMEEIHTFLQQAVQ